jgi:hypothetical protein
VGNEELGTEGFTIKLAQGGMWKVEVKEHSSSIPKLQGMDARSAENTMYEIGPESFSSRFIERKDKDT